MKKFFSILILMALAISIANSQSQTFKYQTVLRDNAGTILANKVVGLKVSILQGASPATVYVEEFTPATDAFGMINLEIGAGTVIYGNYANIDWNKVNNQLQIEIDLSGGQSYTMVGTSPILSVPVANYAVKSGSSSFPAGMIIAFAGNTSKIPEGWILCDGRELNRTDYPALLDAIGLNWGIGNNINTFNVPDLRGQFLRGADLGAGVDPDVATRTVKNFAYTDDSKVGTYESYLNAAHTHSGTTSSNSQNISFDIGVTKRDCPMGNCNCPVGSTKVTAETYCSSTTYNTNNGNHSHTFTTDSYGGAEARPVNAYVNYIIKY